MEGNCVSRWPCPPAFSSHWCSRNCSEPGVHSGNLKYGSPSADLSSTCDSSVYIIARLPLALLLRESKAKGNATRHIKRAAAGNTAGKGSEMRPCIVHMARAATPLMISVEIGLHERLVLGHVLTRLATLDRIGTRRQALARSVFGSLTELQLLHALLLEGEEAKEHSVGGTQHCTTTNKKRTSRYQHCSPVPSEYTSKDKTL